MIIFRAFALFMLISMHAQEQEVRGRKSVVLESQSARLVVDLGGGAIREFRFSGGLNPLSWNTPGPNDTSVHGFGHFLCLDRWGPPSDAEGKLGMPYHGEASNVRWTLDSSGTTEAVMSARLPMAGLAIRREIWIAGSAFAVREEVTNEKPLGRIFNIVQHPTIAPPFLDENTIVDCNGGNGFAQGGTLPNPEQPSSRWPKALKKNADPVDLRHLTNNSDPNVVSYKIDGPYGWVTAANARKGLLIGYIWRTSDYPWVSLWRDAHDGKPTARGLEFGSTGLHQPFPILVQKDRIWDRPLFEYIDARQTITKRYVAFLSSIPDNFAGTTSIDVKTDPNRLVLREQRPDGVRDFTISLTGLLDAL